VDVPAATYVTATKGPGTCGNLAHMKAFDWAKLNTLYGTPSGYAVQVSSSVDRLVRDRWLTEADGKKIKAAAVVAPATASR
jgi:hypothetical protein